MGSSDNRPQVGMVQTTDGPISPEDLGRTIAHEHLFIDGTISLLNLPESSRERTIAKRELRLDDLWFVKRNPLRHRKNVVLGSVSQAINEVNSFKQAGGGTIVEVTPKNTGWDLHGIQAVSRTTGISIVKGTAFYIEPGHPARLQGMTAEDVRDEFIDDIREGMGETRVKPGLIGEIGISQMSDGELKVLRGAAQAARRTGAPLSVHPPLHYGEKSPAEWSIKLLDIIEEEGLPPERVIFCHQDYCDEINHPSVDVQRTLAERGAFIEFDLWGWDMYIESEAHASPSDNWRARATIELIEDGYVENLLFSHDVFTKVQLKTFGGTGYDHVLTHVVPMLRTHGLDEAAIDTILNENPQRILAFAEAR